jgi:hypothetical protein
MSSPYQYSSRSSAPATGEKSPDATASAMELGGRAQQVALEDLPTVVRLAVKYNVGGGGGCVILAYFIGNVLNVGFPLLIFAGATGSLPVGIGFAALAFVSNAGNMAGPNYAKSPLLLAVLHAQADEVAKTVKGFVIFTTIFFSALVMPVAFVYLITPNIINTQMFGPKSYTIALSFAIASCAGMVLVVPMGALGMVFEKVQREWCKRINTYLQQVQERLLKIADGVDSPEDMIARLALLQEENETWAREMNQAYSTQSGLTLPITLTWSFFPLAMIALPSSDDTRLAQVVVLTSFAAFFQVMFIVQLTGLTKVNMAWERSKARLLNDARIQLLRLNTVGVHGAFARWLQNHELNAARACGVKVTLKLLRSSAGAIGSVFILASYLVLRENLSGLLE